MMRDRRLPLSAHWSTALDCYVVRAWDRTEFDRDGEEWLWHDDDQPNRPRWTDLRTAGDVPARTLLGYRIIASGGARDGERLE